ncbi:MAG TPA: Gfo/Idh/MocA family oxidoreductase [Phycisphaerae bacterium]|nr:Gfo/Idh/MocA family oxidoreductase [Phycisphaerae bacterium]
MNHPLRIGIIGLGNIGTLHANNLASLPSATLAAVSNVNAARLDAFRAKFPAVPIFPNADALLAADLCDAVILCGPHPTHVPHALAAFEHNLHVLAEKPLASNLSAAQHLVDTWREKYSHLKFAMMFNQRTHPLYQKLRSLLRDGELGPISRISWTITNWFRPNAYYASSKWRATWKGEGGGVLINQCPHNLDLLHWITGLIPTCITAVGFAGKHHPIEVEDEVSAILEYPPQPPTTSAPHPSEPRPLGSGGGGRPVSGAIGHFITSTGEFPGTNRLEIAGARGKLTAENNTLTFHRSRTPVPEFSKTATEPFASPELWTIDIPVAKPPPNEHALLLENFVTVIQKNLPNDALIAPGPEGLHSLELGNALLQSALTRTPIALPLNAQSFDTFLNAL